MENKRKEYNNMIHPKGHTTTYAYHCSIGTEQGL